MMRGALSAHRMCRAGRTLARFLASKDGDEVRIDRSKLFTGEGDGPVGRGAANSLLVHLRQRIKFRSALTIADYMRECLTNPQHGYYMKNEVFGTKGDFTTAPEISQIFGEMVGIWTLKTFASMVQVQKPSCFRLVELGPGRGTLMVDVLRTLEKLAPELMSVLEVHLMEVSPKLQETQRSNLAAFSDKIASLNWFSSTSLLPPQGSAATVYLAQEFFDALPVHQFQKTEKGWCERMIDVNDASDAEFPLRYVLSRGGTAATTMYRGLLPPDVSEIEISPEAIAIAEKIGAAIKSCDGLGAALIVDYGQLGPIAASLRAIRDHSIEPALASPGEADLSVDVDFRMLGSALDRGGGGLLRVHGPVTQASFVERCGGTHRLLQLLNSASKEQRENLVAAYERLTGPDQMGTTYKALACTHSALPVPLAFDTP